METALVYRETPSGTWDDEHVKALLHFPRFPIRLIQQEPWQGWIGQRGGLKAVYAYLQNYPLSPSHRRILDVVLSNPEAVADVYASRLNISRATYFYQLRELVPALAQALNHWDMNPLPAPPEADPVHRSHLPVPLTALVGAGPVLEALTGLLLRDDVRLLTLLGMGGIGKTRLSLELARRLGGQFGGNICFVDLSSLKDPANVAAAIAEALGVEKTGETQIKPYLRPREFLLILDNFEHILPAGDLVADLLAGAPRLKILVTSRAALHIYGEHEYVVPPLALPETTHTGDLDRLAQSPAVALFVQRAQAVKTGFVLDEENAEAIAELCLRMEGIPLAIELAAFQVKYFSPQAMLVRLSNAQRLNFLSQTSGWMPPQHRTMRAMFDWSYDLLPPELQVLFRRLAAFPGGCTIDAAEKVCSHVDAHAGLTALADRSLLEQQVDFDGEPRFQMRGITREYVLERLEAHGEADSLRRIHALYYLAHAEGIKDSISGRPGNCRSEARERAFTGTRQEYANLKAALQWIVEQHEGESGLRFILALWDYWKYAGDLNEGRQFAQLILEQTADLRLPIRARVLRLAGWLAHDVRDTTTMQMAFQASHDLAGELNDPIGTGLALHGLGELARLRGLFGQARAHIDQSLKLFNELDNRKQIAWSLDLLGRIALSQGSLAAAREYFQQSLASFRAIDSNTGVSTTLAHLGQSLYYAGQIDQAKNLLEECRALNRAAGQCHSSALALALDCLSEIAACQADQEQAAELNARSMQSSREAGYNWCVELASFSAGWMALHAADLDEAACRLQESIVLQQALREDWRALLLLETCAGLAAARMDWLGAARLLGAAGSLRASTGIRPLPVYQPEQEHLSKTLATHLEAATLQESRFAGQELSTEQALAYALRCIT
jgi:predicted ATPase